LKYWFDTSGTIPKGLGFSLFDAEHLVWLAVTVLVLTAMARYYRHSDRKLRTRIRHATAAAIVANEVFKTAMLLIGGNWEPEYLPLHLCSVNILLVAIHAVKPGKLLDNFLYAVCIPGAAAALLFPSWNKLPPLNFMYLHSFTVHILLMAYPIMLTAGGDIRPDQRYIPRVLALLATLALVALGANLIFDTNFMFLMKATKSSPLYFFQKNFGSHLVGFAVILPVVLAAMYLPFRRGRQNSATRTA
jgi:hypothetical integral membrane protein (TIGR02206 family)